MDGDIELHFDYMGISWKVSVAVEEHYLDSVLDVSVWDGKQYIEIDTDVKKFEKDMQDVLNEEIEQYYLNLKLAHEDLMYERAREEGRLK